MGYRTNTFEYDLDIEYIEDNGNVTTLGGTVTITEHIEDPVFYYKDGSGYPGSYEVEVTDFSSAYADEYDNDGELVCQHDPASYEDSILDDFFKYAANRRTRQLSED